LRNSRILLHDFLVGFFPAEPKMIAILVSAFGENAIRIFSQIFGWSPFSAFFSGKKERVSQIVQQIYVNGTLM